MNEPTGQQVGSVPGAIRTHDHRIKRTSDADAPERTPTDAGDAGATPETGLPSETRAAPAPGGQQVGSDWGTRPDLTRAQALCLRLVTERTRAGLHDRANARAADVVARMACQAGASDAEIARAIARGCEA